MKRLVAVPNGWPCTLAEAEPGAFVFLNKRVGYKTEYQMEPQKDTFHVKAFNEGGEYLHLAMGDSEIVQPLEFVWEEYEV